MLDLMKKTLLAGVGLVAVSREKAQKIVEPLVKKGQLSEEQGKRLLNELVKKSEQTRKGLEKTIDGVVRKTLSKMEIPTKQDYLNLSRRIDKLGKKVKTKTKAKHKTSVKRSLTQKRTTR
jgi:polyhydroxyalkanoate synthesis regulator phasin